MTSTFIVIVLDLAANCVVVILLAVEPTKNSYEAAQVSTSTPVFTRFILPLTQQISCSIRSPSRTCALCHPLTSPRQHGNSPAGYLHAKNKVERTRMSAAFRACQTLSRDRDETDGFDTMIASRSHVHAEPPVLRLPDILRAIGLHHSRQCNTACTAYYRDHVIAHARNPFDGLGAAEATDESLRWSTRMRFGQWTPVSVMSKSDHVVLVIRVGAKGSGGNGNEGQVLDCRSLSSIQSPSYISRICS